MTGEIDGYPEEATIVVMGVSGVGKSTVAAAPELLASRISARQNHFMPPTLLASQLATLEMLDGDERGFVVDAAAPVKDIVESAVMRLEASHV